MATVEEIYEQYRIMPGLQTHQLRVAAVCKQIADSITAAVDTRTVVLVGLFHDMGNILKSDLAVFPEFLGDKGREYWEAIKHDYAQRYGIDVHEATLSIAREIPLSQEAIDVMSSMGFANLDKIRDSGSIELKIAEYADCRVAPHEVRSLKDRLYDARERYKGRDENDNPFDSGRWGELFGAAEDIERQIFSASALGPDAINDASVAPIIEELKHFQVD